MKKLNLGCGFDYRDGYINVDNFKECNPDAMIDIRQIPWPFEDNEFDYVLLKHVLEHVGESYAEFRSIMKELYRITKNNSAIEIHVPHYRHDAFWSDPTHVRAFSFLTFKMMSKSQNDEWIKSKGNFSMIAYEMGINFEAITAAHVYDNAWLKKESEGLITRDELRQIALEKWNVVKELQITLKTIKPF